MIYRVVIDGADIYGTSEDSALINPSVTIELNSAGSLEFTMPFYHKNYNTPSLLTSDAEVYENNDLIWYGRVLETSIAMNRNKTVYCEGAFAYFNDSVQRPLKFEDAYIHSVFQTLIAEHNSQVPMNRRFTVGNITVDNIQITYEIGYDKTKNVIENVCINAVGGYLFFRKEDGENYVDWYADMPYTGAQPIQFGLNMVDLKQDLKAGYIRTSVIPIGKQIDGSQLTIADVNGGLDYLDSDKVSIYGRISEVVEFSDIATADELKAAGQRWLSDQQVDPLTVNCDAAELNYLDPSYPAYRVGQKVRTVSPPHFIDELLPIVSLRISLDSAVKKATVGTLRKQELSDIYGSGGGSSGGSYSSIGSGSSSSGSGSSIVVDSELSTSSENPVQNKVVKAELDRIITAINNINSNSGSSGGDTPAKSVGYYIPHSVASNVICESYAENFKPGYSYWGAGSSPMMLNLNEGSVYPSLQQDDSVLIPVNTNNVFAYVDLGSANAPFTAYIVAKTINASTYSRVLCAMNSRSTNGGIMLQGSTLTVDSFDNSTSTGISSANYFVGAIQFVQSGTAKGYVRGYLSNPITKPPASIGRYVVLGRTDINQNSQYAAPCDLNVKYFAVVKEAEAEATVESNMDALYNAFLS